jgi:hypothetical protein
VSSGFTVCHTPELGAGLYADRVEVNACPVGHDQLSADVVVWTFRARPPGEAGGLGMRPLSPSRGRGDLVKPRIEQCSCAATHKLTRWTFSPVSVLGGEVATPTTNGRGCIKAFMYTSEQESIESPPDNLRNVGPE